MEDWILRTNVQEDWVSLIFLLNFAILIILKTTNQSQFKALIRFIDSAIYFKIYGKDFLRFESFNILSTLFLMINLSIGVFYSLTLAKLIPYSFSTLSNIFIQISSIICLRFLFTQFSFKIMGISEFSNIFSFKNFSYQVQISILAFFLFALYEFNYTTQEFFSTTLIVLFGLYILSQFALYKESWELLKHNLLYFILYLCAFKLAPWILFYNSLI